MKIRQSLTHLCTIQKRVEFDLSSSIDIGPESGRDLVPDVVSEANQVSDLDAPPTCEWFRPKELRRHNMQCLNFGFRLYFRLPRVLNSLSAHSK